MSTCATAFRSAKTGKLYYFVTSKGGAVEQWELFDDGTGRLDARRVRRFELGSIAEGIVADDEHGVVYVSNEHVGIWKLRAEPDAPRFRFQVEKIAPAGRIVPDVEGLAIARGPKGTGYLIASNQGNNSFLVYRREGSNAFVKAFRVVDGEGVDGVAETDGVDVTTEPLGPRFPHGLFVAQDGLDDKGRQNFKLVPLERILGPGR
jgi:3-phytase